MTGRLDLLFRICIATALCSIILPDRANARAYVHGIEVMVDGEQYYLDGPADGPGGAKDIPGHYWVRAGRNRLVGKHYNTGPFGAPSWWSSNAPDGAYLYKVHGVIDVWSEAKARRYASRGFVHYHELVRVEDGRPHPEKVVWLKHTARTRFMLDGGPRPDLAHAVSPGVDYLFIPGWDEPYPSLERQVEVALWGDVFEFEMVQLEMNDIAPKLEQGLPVDLPLAIPDTSGVQIESFHSRIVELRPDLEIAYVKMARPSDPVVTLDVPLPVERNYRVGDCAMAEAPNRISKCGALTLLDDETTMLAGLVMTPAAGVSFIEPIDLILGGRNHPGMHIVYNIRNTVNPIGEGEEPPLPGEDDTGRVVDPMDDIDPIILPPFFYTTGIVLDGDRQFYEIDPSTVWQRMDAVFNTVDLIYTVIERLSFDWSLELNIKGMEVWTAGGPTTTNKVELSEELVDPGYLLIHPVMDQEIHLFSVGYNVSGVYGRAAGIGHSGSNAIGGGPGLNHAYAEALTTQSLKTKWVVAAHEIGHLIGGIHGDGALPGDDECAGGLWSLFSLNGFFCAPSLMPAGGAGAPDGRSPFFSNANDTNIIGTLEAVLP